MQPIISTYFIAFNSTQPQNPPKIHQNSLKISPYPQDGPTHPAPNLRKPKPRL